jgi:hypothetical protein
MSEIINSASTGSLLYSNTALAATASIPFIMPMADSYAFILDVISAGGTTEKCDLAIQTSFDGGTTYQDWWRFTQVTTAAVTHCLVTQPMQGHGEAGTIGIVTTGALNSAISANKSCTPYCQLKFTISGTLPTYSVKVWAIMAQRSQAGGL